MKMLLLHNTNILFSFTLSASLTLVLSEQTGPICYSCTGVDDVIACNAVERCSYGQVCFIEKDPSNLGKMNLGCRHAEVCKNGRTDFTCTSCCQGDLCNGNGCDIRELPHQRGPACYKCTDQGTQQGCTKIKHCSVGEVCVMARMRNENNVTFVTDCVNKYFCPPTETYVVGKRYMEIQEEILNKRSGPTTECLHCCSKDLCNDMECRSVYNTQKPTLTSETTPTTHISTTVHATTFPKAVDGIFGEWSSWTRCPYSCGRDGIQHRFRHCNNPPPQNGGQLCYGSKFDTKFCHNAPCCSGPPVITFIENDELVKVGDFVRLHCNASHADSLHWEGPKIIGHKFPENVEVIYQLNLLVISNIAYNNSGPYRCIAQNLCGITSKDVNVDVII